MFQPLRKCIVGKSYAPEFYNFIEDSGTRSRWQRIAEETEEDYQHLINLLHQFDVETIRPVVEEKAEFVKKKPTTHSLNNMDFKMEKRTFLLLIVFCLHQWNHVIGL